MAAYRSGLFEVANAAPGAASSVGIARLERLAFARAPDVALHVLPGRVQRLAARDRARDRQPELLDPEPLGGRPRVAARDRMHVAAGSPSAAPPDRVRRVAIAPWRERARRAIDDQRARARGGDQDRRARRRPSGPAVGELEHQRERIDRRPVTPMVDRRRRPARRLPRHGGDRDERERARQQRRERRAGRSRADPPGAIAHSPPGVGRRVAWARARRGGSARARACWCRAAPARLW